MITLILTIHGHLDINLIFFISCNFTSFYPIKKGFSPEITEFFTESYYKFVIISFLNFYSEAIFRHSGHMGCKKKQLTGNLST